MEIFLLGKRAGADGKDGFAKKWSGFAPQALSGYSLKRKGVTHANGLHHLFAFAVLVVQGIYASSVNMGVDR